MFINPKSNYSRFATLLILSDLMKYYYVCLKVISKAWKPIEDMKFRLEFFSHVLQHMNLI